MRLLFEIGHLKTATPATVSRAGILFLNYADVGWNPWVYIPIQTCIISIAVTERYNLVIMTSFSKPGGYLAEIKANQVRWKLDNTPKENLPQSSSQPTC